MGNFRRFYLLSGMLILVIPILTSCNTAVNQGIIQQAREEIIRTEHDFESMAASRGLAEAFGFYADSAACLNRGIYIIHGKDSIRLFYSSPRFKKVRLEWKPDFVEVSSSADLGYTYGKYTFTDSDSTGKSVQSKGIFHTVWKKQPNGEWRFVWD
jgi:ketosteroid isomerase-like protein